MLFLAAFGDPAAGVAFSGSLCDHSSDECVNTVSPFQSAAALKPTLNPQTAAERPNLDVGTNIAAGRSPGLYLAFPHHISNLFSLHFAQ